MITGGNKPNLTDLNVFKMTLFVCRLSLVVVKDAFSNVLFTYRVYLKTKLFSIFTSFECGFLQRTFNLFSCIIHVITTTQDKQNPGQQNTHTG